MDNFVLLINTKVRYPLTFHLCFITIEYSFHVQLKKIQGQRSRNIAAFEPAIARYYSRYIFLTDPISFIDCLASLLNYVRSEQLTYI